MKMLYNRALIGTTNASEAFMDIYMIFVFVNIYMRNILFIMITLYYDGNITIVCDGLLCLKSASIDKCIIIV